MGQGSSSDRRITGSAGMSMTRLSLLQPAPVLPGVARRGRQAQALSVRRERLGHGPQVALQHAQVVVGVRVPRRRCGGCLQQRQRLGRQALAGIQHRQVVQRLRVVQSGDEQGSVRMTSVMLVPGQTSCQALAMPWHVRTAQE